MVDQAQSSCPTADSDASRFSNRTCAVCFVIATFLVSAVLLSVGYRCLPELDRNDVAFIKLPRRIEDAQELGRVLSRYKEQYSVAVFVGVAVTYVFLQAFAIPGSIFLTILSGYLFPFPVAMILVCTCSALGASLCYMLSLLVGQPIVMYYFPAKVVTWSSQVSKHSDNLLNYILFLRITPFLPNWFINIASPILNVPLSTFFVGTFLGVAPPSMFFVQAGRTLQKLTSTSGVLGWRSIGAVAGCAIAALLPVAFKHRIRSHLNA